MKKIVSLILSAVLTSMLLSCAANAFSVQHPDIITVKAKENGDYGHISYSFFDGNGNPISLFGNNSYIPADKTKNETAFFSLTSSENNFDYPALYDSRENGCITSAKHQGVSGNCWAFSTMSMLESDAIINGIDDADTADYSEAHFSWFTSNSFTANEDDPTYGDGRIDSNPFMVGGNWIIAAGSLARWTGAAEDADYPFNPQDLSAMGNYDEACRYDTGSGVIIKSAEALSDMNDAKEWIMTHGSATLAFYFDPAYYNNASCGYYYNGTHTLNHEITVIGWNDGFPASDFNSECRPSGDGAWLCKNSWGTDWGDDGCFWISYYDTSIDQFAGISARKADNCYRNYTYNGAGWESYISNVGNAKISNVFTSEGSELLNSVSTYTMTPEQEIRISVYKNLPSAYTNPETGELAYEGSVLLKRAGYHTIDLEDKVELGQGTIFSVVIEYITDGTVYLPVEANGQGMNAYSCNACESYVYLPQYNVGWYDTMIYGFENVFVQAFTECNHETELSGVEPTCNKDGVEISVCSLCKKTVSETRIPAIGHNFSDWSDYEHDFKTDKEVSTRHCLKCGYTEKSTIVYSKNTVKIDTLIDMIFERIIEFLRQIFTI